MYEIRMKTITKEEENEWCYETIILDSTEMEESRQSVWECNTESLKEEELKDIKRMRSERIEGHNESSKIAQEKFHEIYERLTIQIYSLVNKVNSELEEKFTAENNCLQENLSGLRSDEDERISKKVQKANAELLIDQFYGFIKLITDETGNEHRFSVPSLCELKQRKGCVGGICWL